MIASALVSPLCTCLSFCIFVTYYRPTTILCLSDKIFSMPWSSLGLKMIGSLRPLYVKERLVMYGIKLMRIKGYEKSVYFFFLALCCRLLVACLVKFQI